MNLQSTALTENKAVCRNDFDAALRAQGSENYQNTSGREVLEELFRHSQVTLPSEWRSCPLCGAAHTSVFGIKYNIPIVDCACGFRYIGKIAPETIDSESDFYQNLDAQHVKFITSSTYDHYTRMRSAYELQIIEDNVAKDTILDIGCGTGIFLDVAAQRGWNVFGLEPNLLAYTVASKKHFHVTNRWFCADDFSKKFDVVTVLDVLEHIPDPVSFLQSIKRIIKDNGIVFIQVPNTWSLACQLRGLSDNIYNGLIHFNYFSLQSLEQVCTKAGFSCVFAESILSEVSVIDKYHNSTIDMIFKRERERQISYQK